MYPFWLLMIPVMFHHHRIVHERVQFSTLHACMQAAARNHLKPQDCLETLPPPVLGLAAD